MPDQPHLDTESLLLIVVGAHPRAETGDRPQAYRLRQLIADRLSASFGPQPPLTPLVVTDVWYINDSGLRRRPTISIGGPGVNALSAYLGDKLPSAFVVDDRFMVQMDLDLSDLIACCWGVSAEATANAVDAFVQRYLDGFLDASARAHAV